MLLAIANPASHQVLVALVAIGIFLIVFLPLIARDDRRSSSTSERR